MKILDYSQVAFLHNKYSCDVCEEYNAPSKASLEELTSTIAIFNSSF